MQASLVIARMMGPLFVRHRHWDAGEQRGLASRWPGSSSAPTRSSITGILILLGGLAILNSNPRWTRDWRSLITLLGWAMCHRRLPSASSRRTSSHSSGTRLLAQPGFLVVVGIFLLSFGAFSHFQGLCGLRSRLPIGESHEQARHHRRSGHPEGHHRPDARFAQGLFARRTRARSARAGARDRADARLRRAAAAGLRPLRPLYRPERRPSTWRRGCRARASNG